MLRNLVGQELTLKTQKRMGCAQGAVFGIIWKISYGSIPGEAMIWWIFGFVFAPLLASISPRNLIVHSTFPLTHRRLTSPGLNRSLSMRLDLLVGISRMNGGKHDP